MKFKITFAIYCLFRLTILAAPLEAVKDGNSLIFDIPVSTPDQSRYITGWLMLFNQPQPQSQLTLTAHSDAGCALEIESPVHLYDGKNVTSAKIADRGALTPLPREIQYLHFTYRNKGHARFCRVRLTVGTVWSSSKALELAKKAEGKLLTLSNWMNLLEAQKKVNYSTVENEKKRFLQELSQFVEQFDGKLSKEETKVRFQKTMEAALEFESAFSPSHKAQGKPQQIETRWKEFQSAFFELTALFVERDEE